MKCSRAVVFALIAGLAGSARAQVASPTDPHQASLSGIVVKEPGSQPIKKVLLHLISEDQKEAGNYTTDTDSEGHFRIEKIQPGRYRLLLEKTGFHQVSARGHQADGSVLTLTADQEIHDLALQMLPAAVITGRIVDEDGEPMANYGVSLLKHRPGKPRDPANAGEERTNDLGEYRFSGLFPGQYFVAVVPPPDVRNFIRPAKGSPSTDKPDTAYLTTYYPNTTDFLQAAPIELRAGEEMPVNLTLIPSRSFRIRGIVTGIPANQKPMVQLLGKGVGQTMNGADVAADGQFEIRGAAPGSYSITVFAGAEGQILTARENVAVVAGDVEGIRLAPVRPFTVTGHVRFEWQGPKDVAQCSVYLRSTDSADPGGVSFAGAGSVTSAQLDHFGNFQWTGIVPGNYVAQFSGAVGPDTYLQAVNLGGTDASAGLTLTGPAAVELVVSSKGGRLEGAVLEDVQGKQQAVPNATVIAVPAEKYRRLNERFGSGSTDQNGLFTIRGLAPGSYTLFAWRDLDDDLYYDEGFLKSQESNGVTVKVEEGSRQKIEIRLSPIPEEWR